MLARSQVRIVGQRRRGARARYSAPRPEPEPEPTAEVAVLAAETDAFVAGESGGEGENGAAEGAASSEAGEGREEVVADGDAEAFEPVVPVVAQRAPRKPSRVSRKHDRVLFPRRPIGRSCASCGKAIKLTPEEKEEYHKTTNGRRAREQSQMRRMGFHGHEQPRRK